MDDIKTVLETIKGQQSQLEEAVQKSVDNTYKDKINQLEKAIKDQDEMIKKYQEINQQLFLKIGGERVEMTPDAAPKVKTEEELALESALKKIEEMNAQIDKK